MNPKVAINRAKMNRFLDSLHVRSIEEAEGRQQVHQDLTTVDDSYKTLRATAQGMLFERESKRRERERPKNVKRRSVPAGIMEDEAPKYVPASKYPLPMQPMHFKPAKKSENPGRILNLSKIRRVNAGLEPDPEPEPEIGTKRELEMPKIKGAVLHVD